MRLLRRPPPAAELREVCVLEAQHRLYSEI
jgi:hypothetical protein